MDSFRRQMELLDKNHRKEVEKLKKSINEVSSECENEINLRIEKYRKEDLELEKEILKNMEDEMEFQKKLMAMNKTEMENRKLIEKIFDIEWRFMDIDFQFSGLLGIQEGLGSIGIDKSNKSQVSKYERLQRYKMNRANRIHLLHQELKSEILEIHEKIDKLLDFLEFGKSPENRTNIFLALDLIKNIKFIPISDSKIPDFLIFEDLSEKVQRIRNLFLNLPFHELTPRESIRQVIWRQIEKFEEDHHISVGKILDLMS